MSGFGFAPPHISRLGPIQAHLMPAPVLPTPQVFGAGSAIAQLPKPPVMPPAAPTQTAPATPKAPPAEPGPPAAPPADAGSAADHLSDIGEFISALFGG